MKIITLDNIKTFLDNITNKFAAKSDIPTKTSQLKNDSDFLTSDSLSLTNYYTKSEVDGKVSSIPKFSIAVVTALPTENISNTTVYLVKTGTESQNLYTEYIYVNKAWEKLGTQSVNLSGYVTSTNAANTYYKKTDAVADLAKKQNTLTFDTTPTAGSTNPVTSGGVKTALDGKINKSGDTMTGALNLANHTWNLAGDDAYFGDANKSGCLCVKGANNDTGITLINRNDNKDEDCAIIRYAGKNIVVNKSIDGNITGTAETAKKLHTYYDRPASANKQFGDGNIYYYLATSTMTEGKPPTDAHIIHLAWDNQGGWDSQIAISHDNHAYWRYQNGGKWGNWRTFLDSGNFNAYAPKLDGTGATGNWNINAKTATAATKLQTARKINGVAFDGTSDISAPWSQNKAVQTIDLTASTYNQDTWYPVVISAANMCVLMEYICYTWLGKSGLPSWATHKSGFTTVFDVCVRNSRWGEFIQRSYVKHDTNSFCKNNVPPAVFTIDNRYPTGAVWYLRGGGKYNLFTSDTVTWRVVTTQTTINGSGSDAQVVAPTTTQPVSNISNKLVTSDLLKTVATSGSYNDLTNKPTIPNKTSQLTNDSGYVTNTGSVASATKATQDSAGNTINGTSIKSVTYDNANRQIVATRGDNATFKATIPEASTTVPGLVKVGTGLTVSSGVLNSNFDSSKYMLATDIRNNYLGKTQNAVAAGKLTVNAGSATHPVYFADGKPVGTTYELNATVPANAKFTDTVPDLTPYAKKTDIPAVTVSGNTIAFGSVKIGVD